MFDLDKDWSVSFAGCGFMGIYYVGAAACILERFPRLLDEATQVCGASAGALMAVVLTTGFPLDKCCSVLMSMAKEARKHKLGPLHPTCNMLQIVQDSLIGNLAEDAHIRASGKLCVSLTRVSDGKNVLVSEFSSRDELIEVLVCSCFIPLYCGVFPPMYRGVRYVDGAISDNLPHCYLKNTITLCAFAGESDICPRPTSLNFHEVRFNNVSIQFNMENVTRVANTFFPPSPEEMAQICQSGYTDALRFLYENNLIKPTGPQCSFGLDEFRLACCEVAQRHSEAADARSSEERQNGVTVEQSKHWWLCPQFVYKLPVCIQRVFCEECKEARAGVSLLSQVTEFFRYPCPLSVLSAFSISQRVVEWISAAGDLYRQAWSEDEEDFSEHPLRRSTSLPSHLSLCFSREDDTHSYALTPEPTPNSNHSFNWNSAIQSDDLPLTPPPTPTFTLGSAKLGDAVVSTPPRKGAILGVGLDRVTSRISNVPKTAGVSKKTD